MHSSDGSLWASNLGEQQSVTLASHLNNSRLAASFDSFLEMTKERKILSFEVPAYRSGNKRIKNKCETQSTPSIPPFTAATERGKTSSLQLEPGLDFFLSLWKGSHINNQFEPLHSLPLPSEPLPFNLNDISLPAIEGVLPVSELFHWSTESTPSSSNHEVSLASNILRAQLKESDTQKGDNSDQLSPSCLKIRIGSLDLVLGIEFGIGGAQFSSEVVQRELITMAEQEREEQQRLGVQMMQTRVSHFSYADFQEGFVVQDLALFEKDSNSMDPRKNRSRPRLKADRGSGRKMVRRGMEMLVGGEPINADPPQRSIELNYYRKHPKLWARAITTNSPDFGPLLHMHSAGKVEKKSIGLFCEHFVDMTQKWGICSDDLKCVVTECDLKRRQSDLASSVISVSAEDMQTLMQTIRSPNCSLLSERSCDLEVQEQISKGTADECRKQSVMNSLPEMKSTEGLGEEKQGANMRNCGLGGKSGVNSEKLTGPVREDSINAMKSDCLPKECDRLTFTLGGELKFSLGVSRAELEQGHGKAFQRILCDGIRLSINSDAMGFDVHIAKLIIGEVEGGSTDVTLQFQMHPRKVMGMCDAESAAKEVNSALANAMNNGKMVMTLAQVARDEKGWPTEFRDRIVKEFLFETQHNHRKEEFESNDIIHSAVASPDLDACDGPFGMKGDVIYGKDDIWLGGGNGGVFFDYSESNVFNSPFKGELGPYLVDAAIERARQNQPRVIAIGDVHGCIDELKALLKKCDYHPGDAIVFLGDLVCKGPDSLSVVQLAREVGALGVRGNHDFEVVRWHQAMKSGADPPVIGSEHYYVASALNSADLKWMYSLPWYISSSHLNALFVHAGFVSGIRLAKQNPRLMMNMRSILPDGTVTSKFFNNWPWARLWDGPQTVFFGHDADRGLQQYEHAIGLDTGCVYGGKLTACILPERRLVSVNAKREYFQYRRKHFD